MSTTPTAINTISPPPIQTPIIGANGLCSPQWVMWFQKVFLRAGGTSSETVTQIVNNVTNNNTSTTISDNSSQGGSSIDPDAIDDLALLSELLPVWRGSEPDNYIPETPRNLDFQTGIWDPSFSGASGSGTIATSGAWTVIANQVFWDVILDASSGSYTSSSGAITNLPYAALIPSISFLADFTNNAAIGSGPIVGNSAFLPDFTLTSQKAVISGRYLWQ